MPSPTAPRGHPPQAPTTPWGIYIDERLRTLHLDRQTLATRLGVSPATITRLLKGRVLAKTINTDGLCVILQLHGAEREAFLNLIRGAFIFPKPAPTVKQTKPTQAPSHQTHASPTIILNSNTDFDIFHIALNFSEEALQGQRDPKRLLTTAQQINTDIIRLVDDGRARETDPAYIALRMRGGMLLGALQETTFGWWQERPLISSITYGDIAQSVSANIRMPRRSDERSELLRMERLRLELRRAVLSREGKHHDEADEALGRLAGALDIQNVLNPGSDMVFIVAYTAQKIHTLAAENRFAEWNREFNSAQSYVASAPVSDQMRRRLSAILDYTYGVGMKRFMWYSRDESPNMCVYFARQAYDTLHALRLSGRGARATHDINLYHQSIPLAYVEPELECSEIDALIWLHPQAAFAQAMSLYYRVQHIYPTLIGKIKEQIDLSLERLKLNERGRYEMIQSWLAENRRQSARRMR